MKHTSLHLLIATVTLLSPLSVEAMGTLSAEDTIAGLGMTVTVQGATPSSDLQILVSGPNGKTATQTAHTDNRGNGTVSIDGKSTRTAGSYTVRGQQNGSDVTTSTSVAVLPENMDTTVSTLQSWTPHIRADGSDTAEVTVTLRDKYGNILPGRPVALVSSRAQDLITALTPETGKDGTQHFSISTKQSGSIQIRAVDLLSGNTLTSSATVQAGSQAIGGNDDDNRSTLSSVDPDTGRRFYAQVGQGSTFDPIDSFDITAPSSIPVGEEVPKVVIRAMDKNGNTVENYAGSVTFESTDPQATLPNFGTYTFQSRDLGQKSFPLVLTFRTPGQQIFRVKDASDSSIVGSATINVGGDGTHPSANGITITSHKDGDTVSTLAITIAGVGPAYANLTVMGGVNDITGTTDGQGNFSIPITLSPSQHDFTIRVQDDRKKNDSGPLHLILDNTAPTIGSITFAPTTPNEGEKVLVVVESESGLGSMTMKIDDANVTATLTENAAASGSYQAFFDAPKGGSYQPSITATDKAGNSATVRSMLSVGMPTLPTVQNVKAESRVNAVALQWDALSDASIEGYRIYVGETPTNFLYSLSTGQITTKATVAGLTPGKTYFFAITALKGDMESKDKSAVVQAAPLGLSLDVEPGDAALHIKWTSLSTDLPLSTFLLEYGTEDGKYTEKRTLNGALRDYTVRDLLNDIHYYLRLTPITVTGDSLEDLAAKGDGTPNGNGFHPGPNDPIPGNLGLHPGGGNPPPTTTGSGVPSIAWMSIAGLGLFGALYSWHRRKMARHTSAFLQAIQSQYYK